MSPGQHQVFHFAHAPEPSPYMVALYVVIPIIVVVFALAVCYICCSRRYRLNWFERHLLQDESGSKTETDSEKEHFAHRYSILSLPSDRRKSSVKYVPLLTEVAIATSPTTPLADNVSVKSETFWVPPDVVEKKRAQSLIPQLIYSREDNTDDEGPGGVPLHIDPMFSRSLVDSHGSSPSHTPTTSSSLQDVTLNMPTDKSSESLGKVPTPQARRGRRASMQDALDHTKINTSLYDKMQSFSYQDSIDSVQEEQQGLGCLNLSLLYDSQYGLLTIKLIQAQELVAKDGNTTANPYCKLRLLPCRRPQLQSRIHKKTLSPELEEEFIFEVPPAELSRRTLEILIFHNEPGSPDECLGQILIPLNLDLSDKTMLWRQVCPYIQKKEDSDYGDIMFSLSYLPSAERLTVVLVKGRNLRPLDEAKNSANPCVKVLVSTPNKKAKKKKTSAQRNTLYPAWNEALVFNVGKEQLKTCTIEFIVSSDNLLGNNEVLGRMVLGPDCKGEDYSHWKDLVKLRSGSARWHALQAAPP